MSGSVINNPSNQLLLIELIVFGIATILAIAIVNVIDKR